MEKQLIISISREYGSGGHIIAEDIAKRFDIELVDSSLLTKIAEEGELTLDEIKKYDEQPKKPFFSRTVRGLTNSPEQNVAEMQFDYLRKLASSGKSFVVVGRCSDEVLKDYKCCVSIFIMADMAHKMQHVMGKFELSDVEAKATIKKENSKRKEYHNRYCEGKWGDSRNYEMCISSSPLGYEKTADIIESYVRERYNKL